MKYMTFVSCIFSICDSIRHQPVNRTLRTTNNAESNVTFDDCRIQFEVKLEDDQQNATTIIQLPFTIICNDSGSNHSIEWLFNDKTLPERRNNRLLTIYRAATRDSGVYSCSITSNNYTEIKSVRLQVLLHYPYCGSPKKEKIVPVQTYALTGQHVTWKCSAFIGEMWFGSNYSVTFYKILDNGAKLINDFDETGCTTTESHRNGVLTGTLSCYTKLTSFGEYSCEVVNQGKHVKLSFYLIKGVFPVHLKIGCIRVFILILSVSLISMGSFVLYWRHCRVPLALKCIEYQHHLLEEFNEESGSKDCCIIHGEDADDWIMSCLVPTLEEEVGITCYLPQRDIRGGDGIVEQITETLARCRKIFIVISPELFRTEISSLAIRYAVALAFGRVGKIVCILVSKVDDVKCRNLDEENLLPLLKTFKCINCPKDAFYDSKIFQEKIQKMNILNRVSDKNWRVERECGPSTHGIGC